MPNLNYFFEFLNLRVDPRVVRVCALEPPRDDPHLLDGIGQEERAAGVSLFGHSNSKFDFLEREIVHCIA